MVAVPGEAPEMPIRTADVETPSAPAPIAHDDESIDGHGVDGSAPRRWSRLSHRCRFPFRQALMSPYRSGSARGRLWSLHADTAGTTLSVFLTIRTAISPLDLLLR